MIPEDLTGEGRGITNPTVLRAMRTVPRHEFVPEAVRNNAYADGPLPIGHGQTISQPFVVAFMTEKLELRPTDRVLEIGTGSGYQAAVLAEIVAQVYSVEFIEDLAIRARATLERLGYSNVFVRTGDGWQGWPEAAPFDAIILTCAPLEIPRRLVDQLKEGGRMILPIGEQSNQELVLIHKKHGEAECRNVLPVRFVPMVGGGPS